MTLPLSEQVVLITGAGRGLGSTIAESFAREGAKVAINYRNSREGAELLSTKLGDRAHAFQADVRDPDAVNAMIAEVTQTLGEPTTVVHNALADFVFNGDARKKIGEMGWSDYGKGNTYLGGKRPTATST